MSNQIIKGDVVATTFDSDLLLVDHVIENELWIKVDGSDALFVMHVNDVKKMYRQVTK